MISAEHFTWSSSFLVEHLLVLTTSSWMVSKACVKAATLVSNLCTLNLELEGGHLEPGSALHFFFTSNRYQGFIGGLEFSPPGTIHPPRNLETEYGFVTGKQQSYPRLQYEGSKLKISWGGGMPPDPPSRHTCLCVCESAFTPYYHPANILFPPNSKSCMKPWVYVKPFGEKYPLPQVFSW